jgi:hypothetical protein
MDKMRLGVVVHACDPSIQEAETRQSKKFKASLGYIATSSLKKQTKCTRG